MSNPVFSMIAFHTSHAFVSHDNVSIRLSLFPRVVRLPSVMFLHAVSVIIFLFCASSSLTQLSFQLSSYRQNRVIPFWRSRSNARSSTAATSHFTPRLLSPASAGDEIKSRCSTSPDFQIATLGWNGEERNEAYCLHPAPPGKEDTI